MWYFDSDCTTTSLLFAGTWNPMMWFPANQGLTVVSLSVVELHNIISYRYWCMFSNVVKYGTFFCSLGNHIMRLFLFCSPCHIQTHRHSIIYFPNDQKTTFHMYNMQWLNSPTHNHYFRKVGFWCWYGQLIFILVVTLGGNIFAV